MMSDQAQRMADQLGSIADRLSQAADLATRRDIAETLHTVGSEPEGVTYAEVDAGGVPALWCIPEGSDADHVLLHNHMGGTVVTSMYSDRKAAGHIAGAAGVRALVLNYRRSPEHKSPLNRTTWRRRIGGCLPKGNSPNTSPVPATPSAETWP